MKMLTTIAICILMLLVLTGCAEILNAAINEVKDALPILQSVSDDELIDDDGHSTANDNHSNSNSDDNNDDQTNADDGLAVHDSNQNDGDTQTTEGSNIDDQTSSGQQDIPGNVFPYTFNTDDLYGNAVTEADIGGKELFFVHYWATWCPPCISEMPDLAEISREYADRVGFIALIDDFNSNTSGAIAIIEDAQIPETFIMIDAYTAGLDDVREMLSTGYVPTTVLLDVSGDMLGSPIIGAYGLGYAEFLDEYLD